MSLCRVLIEKIHEKELTEEDLSENDQVIFKFIKQQYLKCLQIAHNDVFLEYLRFIEKSYDITKVQNFIHMILMCISMP